MNSASYHTTLPEAQVSNAARWLVRIACIGVAGLIAWSNYAVIDQITRAQATVIASGRTQIVQAADSGVLTKLHVKEGDKVTEGQLLATLEKQRAQAAVNDSHGKVAALRITLARLQAETYGQALKFDPSLQKFPEYIRNQTQLYTKRKSAIEEDVGSLENMVKLAQNELNMNLALEKTGDVSKSEILRLQRAVADLQAQITNKRNKYFQDAQAEMTKAQEELSTQSEQLRERSQVLQHTELRAPSAGVVKNLKVTTMGGVLRPGDTVLEILPTDGDLIVEAKISPADIAFIANGQSASVKLDAYDYAIFGAMQGEVTYISADTLSEETRQGPVTYYRVLIRINGNEYKAKAGDQIKIRPGMTASVDIKAMERTVLSYLTKPVTKTLGQSLGER
jgi:membrane fusion protein, adhesin transport system